MTDITQNGNNIVLFPTRPKPSMRIVSKTSKSVMPGETPVKSVTQVSRLNHAAMSHYLKNIRAGAEKLRNDFEQQKKEMDEIKSEKASLASSVEALSTDAQLLQTLNNHSELKNERAGFLRRGVYTIKRLFLN